MPILNYTTEIAAGKTVGEIQALLVKAGARSILADYDEEGLPVRISFLIKTQWGERGFALPANSEAVFAVLVRQANSGKVAKRYATQEQAARVGWRIVKDWTEAQLALIETEMVTLSQVMLPYMVVEKDKTLYELMAQNNLMLPSPKGE